jgi:hypothetical protein
MRLRCKRIMTISTSEDVIAALIAQARISTAPASSTGPKSHQGKVTAARNAYKGGWRALLLELRQALREQDRSLNIRGG